MTASGSDAKTYHQIQLEELALENATLRQKPGAEITTLPPGQQPFNTANVWNTGDRAPEPPVGGDDTG